MKAGPLTAELDGPDLRSVWWGGLEIASRIQVTVRDERWGTVRPALLRADVDERADAFTVVLEAAHGDGAFAWRGTIEATSAGSLTFTIEATAERDLVYRRIGICVEHPWAPYVGAPFVASGIGAQTRGAFPATIAPQPLVGGVFQPLIPAFSHLDVTLPGAVRTVFAFEGEAAGYELEDQRNWTDPSFKSYPTPLRRSQPRTLRRGAGLRQRLEVHIDGAAPGVAHDDGPVVLSVTGASGHAMPDVGVTAPLGAIEAAALRDLQPAHLRVVVDPHEGVAARKEVAALARSADVPLELVYLLDENAAAVPAAPDVPLARVLALRRDGVTSDASFIANARASLHIDGVPLAGGTASHFSELNRRNPDPRGMDAIAVALTPQMHAIDEPTMVASLEIQSQIVTRLRALAGGLPVIVSRVTLAPHEGTDDDGPDERVASPFGAAWTVGSVANLAQAGAASVTLHEAVDRTILPSVGLTAAVRELTSRRGRALDTVRSSDPRRVVGIAADGAPILVANLTPEPQDVVVDGRVPRVLGPYELAPLERSPR